jgi:plastocyanin
LADVRSRRAIAVLAALTLALGAAACGDDNDDGDGGETTAAETEADTTEVTVTADEVSPDEYTFELSATPTAETETVTFDNQGEEAHALIFARINEGFTVDEAFELQGRQGSAVTVAEGGAAPGKTDNVKVTETIEPGNYVMLCPIGNPEQPETLHYKLGQLEEFTIE